MDKKDYKIHIVGAGVSGLIAATILEKNGFSPVIIESTNRVGGRLKTDIIDGYQLDQGFQVLLTAYPAAQKYLDLESLEMQKFLPGASVFKNTKQEIIGDPIGEASLLFSTVFTGIGTFADKLKIFKLNNQLKKKTVVEIFQDKKQTTLSYLEGLGFSTKIIDNFFKPFFSGIFIENKLETSSRMFQFVYKMFGEGDAAIPKNGIEAIPKQLLSNLNKTSILYKTKVSTVTNKEIVLCNGQKIESDFTIIATEVDKLVQNVTNQPITWQGCDTLYFETEDRTINKRLIGLIPENNSLINNIFYCTSLETQTKQDKELLSVTVVDNQNISIEKLIDRVTWELKNYCGIIPTKFIKHYYIPKSLPKLQDLKYDMSSSETRITDRIFKAGDVQLNGSLNAAMLSGEKASLEVLKHINTTD